MHFSRSKRIAFITILFFMCGVSVAVLVLHMIKEDGTQFVIQMETVHTNQVIESRYNDLQTILDQSEFERDKLNDYLLSEDDTVRFLSEIEGIAKSMGLQLTTDSLSVAPFPSQTFQKIDLKFRVSGLKNDVILFISALESLPYYSRIEALSLDRVGDVWQASVTLMVGLH